MTYGPWRATPSNLLGQGTTPSPSAPQVFQEVKPGLGLSRLGEADFLSYVELATLATRYIRVKEVRCAALAGARRGLLRMLCTLGMLGLGLLRMLSMLGERFGKAGRKGARARSLAPGHARVSHALAWERVCCA